MLPSVHSISQFALLIEIQQLWISFIYVPTGPIVSYPLWQPMVDSHPLSQQIFAAAVPPLGPDHLASFKPLLAQWRPEGSSILALPLQKQPLRLIVLKVTLMVQIMVLV